MPRLNVKDQRRQELIEANIRAITKHGLTGTTITHVAQGAELSRGIVNFYFTTKESMMLHTLKYLVEEQHEWWRAAREKTQGKSLRTRLDALFALYLDGPLAKPRRLAVWAAFMGHAATAVAYRKLIAGHDAALCDMLRAVCVEGKRSKDGTLLAAQLACCLRGAWAMSMAQPEGKTRGEVAKACRASLDALIGAQENSSARREKPAVAGKPKKKGSAADSAVLDLFSFKK